jgi:hypothetical protein
LDDGLTINAIDVPARSLACRRMTGEKQEMDAQRGVARTKDTERIQEEVFRHRWIPGTSGQTLDESKDG